MGSGVSAFVFAPQVLSSPRHEGDDLSAELHQVRPEVLKDRDRDAVTFTDQAEQEMFRPDVAVTDLQRLAQGKLQYLFGARCEWGRPARGFSSRSNRFLYGAPRPLDRDAALQERMRCHSFFLMDESEQNVLGADVGVVL
jgi:hypothetical protein